MVEPAPRTPKQRDVARIVAWSTTVVLGVTLGTAGVVYEPNADVATLCGSASFAFDLRAYEFAREQIQLAAKQDPDDPWVNLLQAKLSFVDEDLAAAERHLDRVLAVEPENGEAHLYYGYSAYERGDYELALRHYDAGGPRLEATGKAPLIAEYLIRRGQLLIATGRCDEADRVGQRLVVDGTRPGAGHLISAFSRLGHGDDTEFGQGLARAYSSDPFEPLFRQGSGPLSKAFPWLPAR